MKLNQDHRPHKELNQSLFLVTAKQNCTDFDSLIDYLNNHQYEVESALRNYGVVAIRGYEVKTIKQFQQVGLSIFPELRNQYPGGAPRYKVAEYVWTASSVPSYQSICGHTETSYLPSEQPPYIGTYTIFKPKYSPNSLCERQKPIRLLVNQLKKRKDIAVRKASIAFCKCL